MEHELPKVEATHRSFLVCGREVHIAEPPDLKGRIMPLSFSNRSCVGRVLVFWRLLGDSAALCITTVNGCRAGSPATICRLRALVVLKFADTFFQSLDTLEQALNRRFRFLYLGSGLREQSAGSQRKYEQRERSREHEASCVREEFVASLCCLHPAPDN